MQRAATISVSWVIGLLILGMAIFARQFGLDPNPGWGRGRIALVLLGLLVIFVPSIVRRPPRTTDALKLGDFFLFPALLIVIGVYFWFITISHDATSNYYSLLATAFRRGELSLPLKPDPALLALPNPYDPAAREDMKVPLDLSLYNGKFYLYWGPAPALLLAIAQPFLPGRIGEADLLFLFMSGIFLSQFSLLIRISDRYFPATPKWLLVLSIVLAGFANPALWLLSQPKIYEAAIAGAQFFFIAGFVSAIVALDRPSPSGWGLALAGILWSLAVNTRTVAVFPVIFMTIMIIYWLLRTRGPSLPRLMGKLASLGLPLLIGALSFVGYNWARFGSLLETGFTYQLAGPHLQEHLSELFLPGYIWQNLYNYVLHPYEIRPSFPFLYPIRGVTHAILAWIPLPEFYTAQAIAGFLPAVPFTIFAIVPVTRLWKQFFSRKNEERPGPDPISLSLNWLLASLIGSFAAAFLSLLAFFWAAMRYAEDFMPALILLSIIGFWQGYPSLSQKPKTGKMYAIFGVILAGFSIICAILLALSILYSNGLL